MNIRRTAAAALAGLTLAAAGAFAAPSSAVESGTPVSLTVTAAGGLALSVPAAPTGSDTVDLGSVAAGSVLATAPNALGEVRVTDTRTGVLNNWVASASASALLLDGNAANATDPTKSIPAAALGYTTGTLNLVAAPSISALPTNLPSLAAPLPVVTTLSIGANTVAWTPRVVATVLPTNLAGVYEGTVTHSVL